MGKMGNVLPYSNIQTYFYIPLQDNVICDIVCERLKVLDAFLLLCHYVMHINWLYCIFVHVLYNATLHDVLVYQSM